VKHFKWSIIAACAFLLLTLVLQAGSMAVFTVDITSPHWRTLNGLVWVALMMVPACMLVGLVMALVKEEW
jgi:hypothetical protein